MVTNVRDLTVWFFKTVYKSFVWSGMVYTIPIDICLFFTVRMLKRFFTRGETSIQQIKQ